jgi:hypothetical protein
VTKLTDPKVRFDAKVSVVPITGCWLWLGTIDRDGYAKHRLPDRWVSGHRFAYQAYRGEIPEGLTLDHLCRNRWCVNPAHLEPVTTRVNTLRGDGPSAVYARSTHCIREHSFDDHGYRDSRGKRQCRVCSRMRWLAHYYRSGRTVRRARMGSVARV